MGPINTTTSIINGIFTMNNTSASGGGNSGLNRLRDLSDDYLPDGSWLKWLGTVLLVYLLVTVLV